MAKKFILKAKTGINPEVSQELYWSEEEYYDYQNGDENHETEIRGLAHELVNLDYWVEEVED